jgi:alpha-N-acetylglucosamine transferase
VKKNLRFSFVHLSLIDRLIFLDADGLILKNMDHLLFDDSLLVDYDLGMALSYWFLPSRWLTSIFILVKPSESLYGKLRAYLSSNNFKVLKDKKEGHFDMDIINHVFGNQVQIMSKDYAMLDSYFENQIDEKQFNQTFYVHFSFCKPSHYKSRCRGFLSDPQKPWTLRRLFQIYFSLHDQLCMPKFIGN